jgi:hypothetical protein
MKKKLSIILLITTTLVSTTVKSQNKESETSFIGEINPSIQIARTNNSSEIIDFDQGVMLLFAEEVNMEARKKEVAISLIDFKIQQFGKIGASQKLYLPQSYDLEWHNRKTYNLLDFKYKVVDFGNYLIFIDYEKKKIYSCNFGTSIQSFNYDRTYFRPTKQVFTNEKGEFIIEYVKPSDNDVKIYQIFNKNGEQTNVVKKNKKFIPVCSYFRGVGSQRRYYEENPDCAFNSTVLHAYAREPKLYNSYGGDLSKEVRENENTVFVQFYKGNYKDRVRDNSFIYTYNFTFDKGKVSDVDMQIKPAVLVKQHF